MSSFIRISALLWADILVKFALFELQDYLTGTWGLSFTHAAGIINIWNGIYLILQPLFLFCIGRLLKNFELLVISSSAYTLGTWCLFMSAPPVLANATGTCKEYKKECVGEAQKALFYIGLAFIAVGKAGNNVSIKPFFREQQDRPLNDLMEVARMVILVHVKLAGTVMLVVVVAAGALALPYIKPWTYRFGIPAVCTTIAWLSFFTGLCCTKYYRPKSHQIKPNLFRTASLRMWLAFLVFGIVSSTGDTYSVEQAKHLDRRLGTWKVPTQVLLLVQLLIEKWSGALVQYLAREVFRRGQGIVLVKTLEVLCCVAAARIEMRRLGAVRRHGLLDRPDADVPMSLYWLLFQYVLLGSMGSSMEKSLSELFEGDAPVDSDQRGLEVFTLRIFSKGVAGVGYMCGVLCVYVVEKVTEEGGEPGWFRFTLNRSQLDRYYWLLAVLSAASLVAYVLVRRCTRKKSPNTTQVEEEEDFKNSSSFSWFFPI